MKSVCFTILLVSFPLVLSGVTHQVDMVGMTFVPDTLAIVQGDSVLWVNTSAMFHTTTSGINGVPNGYWDSGLMAPNDSFAFHFDSIGVFPYYCTPHWTLGMVGQITVGPVGISEYRVEMPINFMAGEPYPNPFKGTVRMGYLLDTPGRLRTGVYDATGQLVRSLTDATLASGEYTTVWDGRDATGNSVAAGVYFMRVTFGDNSIQRKVLLLR